VILLHGRIGRVGGVLGDELVSGELVSQSGTFESSRVTFVLPLARADGLLDEIKMTLMSWLRVKDLGEDPDAIMSWAKRPAELTTGAVPALPGLVAAFYYVATRRVLVREEMNIMYLLMFGHERP
jgi:hypothetical protein